VCAKNDSGLNSKPIPKLSYCHASISPIVGVPEVRVNVRLSFNQLALFVVSRGDDNDNEKEKKRKFEIKQVSFTWKKYLNGLASELKYAHSSTASSLL
jgi:hypothetical protein